MPTTPNLRLVGAPETEESIRTNPDALRLLRQRLGMTRTELHQAVGRSAAFVGQAEKESKTFPADLARKYALALDVPVRSLAASIPESAPEALHFRTTKMGKRQQEQVNARANIVCRAVEVALSKCAPRQIDPIPQYDPTLFADGAAGVARRVREELGQGQEPIVHLTELLESRGVLVEFTPPEVEQVKGLTLRREDAEDGPLMLVSPNLPVDTQRHTLAHELGHYVMDRSDPLGDEKAREARADEFAGEFLAPYKQIQEHLHGATPGRDFQTFMELRAHWGVHPSALVFRAHKHGDITDRQRTSWYQTINLRKKYINAVSIPFQIKPTAVPSLLLAATAEEPPEAIAAETGFYERELRREISGWESLDQPRRSLDGGRPRRHLQAVSG